MNRTLHQDAPKVQRDVKRHIFKRHLLCVRESTSLVGLQAASIRGVRGIEFLTQIYQYDRVVF